MIQHLGSPSLFERQVSVEVQKRYRDVSFAPLGSARTECSGGALEAEEALGKRRSGAANFDPNSCGRGAVDQPAVENRSQKSCPKLMFEQFEHFILVHNSRLKTNRLGEPWNCRCQHLPVGPIPKSDGPKWLVFVAKPPQSSRIRWEIVVFELVFFHVGAAKSPETSGTESTCEEIPSSAISFNSYRKRELLRPEIKCLAALAAMVPIQRDGDRGSRRTRWPFHMGLAEHGHEQLLDVCTIRKLHDRSGLVVCLMSSFNMFSMFFNIFH